MRRLTLIAIGVCLAGATGWAQDPLKVSPKVYRAVVDNDRVRVLHVAAGVGEKTAMHQHPDNVTVLLTDGKITFTGPDGKSETADTKAGQALWSGPQTHAGANAGSGPLEAIVVELKGSTAPTATPPAARSNLQMTRLVENARVDVYRVTADPTFKEPPKTTHEYDQVVIALSPSTTMLLEVGGKPKTTWKRGDVVFIGRGQPHHAQNTGAASSEFIIVTIK